MEATAKKKKKWEIAGRDFDIDRRRLKSTGEWGPNQEEM
jgi:hypothetical protein